MIQEKVSPEVAQQEIEAWLDAKRISSRKREEDGYKQAIETLVDGVVAGILTIREDRTIEHALLFPLDGFADKLEYKSRITVEAVNSRMKGVKDGSGRIMATIAALTDKATAVISKLDTEDFGIAQAVAIFFL
jgi:hypothetical protein